MKTISQLIFIVILCIAKLTHAQQCTYEKFDGNDLDASAVLLNSDPVLIVTHASTVFDGRMTTKLGIDQTVAYAKKNHYQVVYLQTDLQAPSGYFYFPQECKPDYLVASSGGGFIFKIPSRHMISVGGHWQACQKDTLLSVLKQWASLPEGHFRITYVMSGIYIFPHIATPEDPYYSRMRDYLDQVNPQHKASMEKLNLLEMMNLIGDDSLKEDYLRRMTPPQAMKGVPSEFDPLRDIPENFELRLELNGEDLGVLRPGKSPKTSTIVFSYID